MITPCVFTSLCYALLHCYGFCCGVIRDADICRILGEVVEGSRCIGGEPSDSESFDLCFVDVTLRTYFVGKMPMR